MAGSNRVTLEEIGRRLNISTGTVSRALRQDALIHPETRARVNAMAMDLGYQGRARNGLNLGKKKYSVSVLFGVTSLSEVRNSYISTCYLHGLTTEAERSGMALHLHTVAPADDDNFKKTAGIPRGLWSAENDAVIAAGQHHPETIAALARKIAVISLAWEYPEGRYDLVTTPDVSGMEMIVQKLVRLGHRRLAWVGSLFRGSFMERRKAGFVHGCQINDLALSDQYFFDPDLFADYALARPEGLLDAWRRGITAFVCAGDHAAEQVIDAFRAGGVRVPQDVSVTGFDHSLEPGPGGSNPVTSIDPHHVEMGRAAVRLVKWRLEEPSALPMTVSLTGQLIEGDSTGVAPELAPA